MNNKKLFIFLLCSTGLIVCMKKKNTDSSSAVNPKKNFYEKNVVNPDNKSGFFGDNRDVIPTYFYLNPEAPTENNSDKKQSNQN